MWPALALAGFGVLAIVAVLWISLDGYLEQRCWNQSLKRLTKDLPDESTTTY